MTSRDRDQLIEYLPASAAESDRVRAELEGLWQLAFGRVPGRWLMDLDELKRYFDPVATGRRLRASLSALPASDAHVAAPFAISIGEQKLITPEGRAALELIRHSSSAGDERAYDARRSVQLQLDLLEAYRGWGRYRLMSVVDLIGGGAKPLQMPAMGSVLVLLVNRSDVASRAIPRFAGDDNPRAREQIDDAVFACSEAFASALQQRNRRKPGKERLISGWTLHEVTRRLPGALSIDDAGVYIVARHRVAIVELLGRELAGRNLSSHRRVEEAFDALVEEFRSRSSVLAAHGALFERPRDTAELRERLIASWKAHSA